MASPVPPHQGLSALRATALALTLEVGGLGLGQAVVISEKENKTKKAAMCLKEKHLACETLLALRLWGL